MAAIVIYTGGPLDAATHRNRLKKPGALERPSTGAAQTMNGIQNRGRSRHETSGTGPKITARTVRTATGTETEYNVDGRRVSRAELEALLEVKA